MAIYTADEQNRLNELQTTYDNALAAYMNEKAQNDAGHAAQPFQTMQYGTTYKLPFLWGGAPMPESSFTSWLSQSDTSLNIKKAAATAAKIQLDTYKLDLQNKYQMQFALENPQAFVAAQEAQAQGIADAAKATAQGTVDAQAQAAKDKRTRMIVIGGIIVVVIVVGVIVYVKYLKRKKAGGN